MVTSPSMRSASSNARIPTLCPASDLSMTIALNALMPIPPGSTCGAGEDEDKRKRFIPSQGGALLRRLQRGRAMDRLLLDRQVDQRRGEAEQDGEPPDHAVIAVDLVEQAAEPHAEEAADLVREEREAVEHGHVAGAEHQHHQG